MFSFVDSILFLCAVKNFASGSGPKETRESPQKLAANFSSPLQKALRLFYSTFSTISQPPEFLRDYVIRC